MLNKGQIFLSIRSPLDSCRGFRAQLPVLNSKNGILYAWKHINSGIDFAADWLHCT